jgi:5-methyltetrahydrofolate--homocysteine methyltransferase
METVLKGRKGVVRIAPDLPTVLISKPVNPTGRKRLTDEWTSGNIEIAKNEALAHIAAGADVISVNVGVVGREQVALLPCAVETIQNAVEVPLSIDTPDPEALAAALKVYQGKPLVNSVSGEEKSLSQVLPLIAEHGAAVVGLCVNEDGIPADPARRLEIAHKIVARAEDMGIHREDVLINCMTMPVESDHEAALVTLETIRLVRAELGVNITLDTSSISGDLPNCSALGLAFLAMAIMAGVNAPIVNTAQAKQTIVSLDLLLGRDEFAMRYIRYYHFRRSGMRGLVDWELVDW